MALGNFNIEKIINISVHQLLLAISFVITLC